MLKYLLAKAVIIVELNFFRSLTFLYENIPIQVSVFGHLYKL
jgi:hypothetical protein